MHGHNPIALFKLSRRSGNAHSKPDLDNAIVWKTVLVKLKHRRGYE
jgi:hypothetical protein